eukprot:9049817-Pyramimonas_sp.AAC.2
MQFPIVDAALIAQALLERGRNPLADRNQTNTFVVNRAGYDLDDPTTPREANGSIRRPPGGLGCPACADNARA